MSLRKSFVLAAAAALTVATTAPASEPVRPAEPARVRAVLPGAHIGGRLVAASLAPARRATVSTRIAATVREVHVEEGQRVAAGQLLVSLADDDVRGALAAATSAVSAATAQERRIRALLAERAATPAELEQAEAQRAQAEAALAAARASVGYAALRAPFAATVQARRVDPGDLVGPGQPILELEGDALELVASLSQDEAKGLAPGATLRFEAGGVRGTVRVTSLTPGGDPISHRRGLRARVVASDAPLRSGAFARVEVAGGGEGASGVWVPRRALVERGDLTGVFVAANGRAELRWISAGEPSGDDVPVRAGLRAGEVVIDAPGALRDGQAIEVLP